LRFHAADNGLFADADGDNGAVVLSASIGGMPGRWLDLTAVRPNAFERRRPARSKRLVELLGRKAGEPRRSIAIVRSAR
jgi:hypothetical protein